MWRSWSAFIVGGLLGISTLTEAQWGVPGARQRRRGDGAVRPEDVPGGLSFTDLQRIAKSQGSSGGAGKAPSFNPDDFSLADLGLGDLNPEEVGKMIDDMLEMPEIQELMEDPEKLREAIETNPLFNNMPGMKKLMDSPEFKDPTQLKTLFQEGLKEFKEMTQSVVDILNDPNKKEEIIDELMKGMSAEEKRRMERLMAGDPDAVEEAANDLADMLSKASQKFKEDVEDPDKMESARKAFVDQNFGGAFRDPDLKAAATDPDKWAELMRENARLIYAAEEDEPPRRKRGVLEEL